MRIGWHVKVLHCYGVATFKMPANFYKQLRGALIARGRKNASLKNMQEKLNDNASSAITNDF